MAQRLPTRCNPDDRLNQRVLAGTMIKAHGLMEGTPFNIAPEEVGRALATVGGVASVHDLHIWSVAPEQVMLSAHLVVRDPRQWETVLDACHTLLIERFAIKHATLQPEPMTRTVRWLDAPPYLHHRSDHQKYQ
jgi:cobalt-zinc-cadmium efflux system protein